MLHVCGDQYLGVPAVGSCLGSSEPIPTHQYQ